MRRVSMATRDELLAAVSERYRASCRAAKKTIIDEFAATTGYHRKHAMRVLRTGPSAKRSAPRPLRRIYGAAEREALIVLWEASDRVCGKRLKAIIPTLVEAMERHGHLALAAEVRTALLKMSAATIDRALQAQRERCSPRRRRAGAISTIRRSIPVRTFSDWRDPPPGFVEADLVAHSGPVTRGSFVQTLVVTDIASGWTELAPLLVREQTLLVDVLREIRRQLPFPLLGFDTDNDTVFMNETVRDYCSAEKIEFTRCRPYRKNDQAHVEQKNGDIVRRMVGYRRYDTCLQLRRTGWWPCRKEDQSAGQRSSGRSSRSGNYDPARAAPDKIARALVLLHHKFLRRECRGIGAEQHGHRGRVPTRAAIRRRRMVAIEFGMWRSVRSGGAAGSVTVGNGKFFEPPGGTSSTGGNRLPLGDQEAVGRDAQRRMVMKAAPSAALEMAQPNLLLELLIIALDAPAQFGDVDQAIEGEGVW